MKRLLLLCACCLALAASAVTIDSPEVGQFIKLPDWAPDEVDSAHTPGSPDSMVDVCTTTVHTVEWKFGDVWIFPNENVAEDEDPVWYAPDQNKLTQPTFVEGQGWNVDAAVRSILEGVPRVDIQFYQSDRFRLGSPNYEVKDEGADTISVTVSVRAYRRVNGRVLGFEYEFQWTLTAKRKETRYHPTGRRVVRAIRLTTNMLSSVCATLEALYERTHYSVRGPHNSWDTDDYGPLVADNTFWFSIPGYGDFPYMWPDDGRTMEHERRLVSTNVFAALCGMDRLVRDVYGGSPPHVCVYRPGWHLTPDNYYWSLDERLYWSSTVFDDMGIRTSFPEFDWVEHPLYPSVSERANEREWREVFAGFRDLDTDPGRSLLVWSRTDGVQTIPRLMFERVNFGEPPFDDRSEYGRYLPHWSSENLTNRTDDVFVSAFGDSVLATNGSLVLTRRLDLDPIGLLNQAVSCMDRTYKDIPEMPGYVATVRYMYKSRSYGDSRLAIDLGSPFKTDSLALYFHPTSDASVPMMTLTATNGYDVTTVVTTSYAVAVSSPTGAGWAYSGVVSSTNADVRTSIGKLIGEIERAVDPRLEEEDVVVYVPPSYEVVGGSIFRLVCVAASVGGSSAYVETAVDVDVGAYLARMLPVLDSSVTYERDYLFARTDYVLMPTNAMPYPCVAGSHRAADGLLTTLAAVAGAAGDRYESVSQNPASRIDYGDVPFADRLHVEYKTWTNSYQGGNYQVELEGRNQDVVDRCHLKVANAIGPKWNTLDPMIPMKDADVEGLLNSFVITRTGTVFKVTLGAVGNIVIDREGTEENWDRVVGAHLSYGEIDFLYVEDHSTGSMYPLEYDPDMEVVVGTVIVSPDGVTATHPHIYPDNVTYGAAFQGNATGSVKVDWKWNCLRLNKDE